MSTRARPSVRLVVLVLALGVTVLLGTTAWRLWHVRAELTDARTSAAQLQQALQDRDLAASRRALASLQAHSASAADQTSGPVWALLTHTPVYGDDAAAVRTMAEVLRDMSTDGLSPLVDIVASFDDGDFSLKAGRLPVGRIQRLQGPVHRSRLTFDRAASQVAPLRHGSYVGPVAGAARQLADIIDRATHTIGRADKVVQLLPSMLGADGPRRYLLVLQNNAEIRSTGGFPGSTFLLAAKDGRITLGDGVSGASFPQLSEPAVALTPSETSLFGTEAGTRFVDANRIPDFPRVAALWSAHWERRFGGTLDGVVTADPVLLSYLLESTGPVQAGPVRLDASNAVQELLSNTYSRILDPVEQDAFFRLAGAAAFQAVTTTSHVEDLLRQLRRGADEGRLLVFSSHRSEQAIIGDTEVAGSAPDRSRVGVYVDDWSSSKLSYYLTVTSTLADVTCSSDGAGVSGQTLIRSSAPPGGVGLAPYVIGGSGRVPPGDEGLDVFLAAPAGARIQGLTIDGRDVAVRPVRYRGTWMSRLTLTLKAGSSSTVGWHLTGIRGVSALTVWTTPQIHDVPRAVGSVACPSQ